MTKYLSNNQNSSHGSLEPELGSSFDVLVGARCRSGVPPELLGPVDEEGIQAAVDELDVARNSLLRQVQTASRNGEDTPEIEALVALDQAVDVYAVGGTEIPVGDLSFVDRSANI